MQVNDILQSKGHEVYSVQPQQTVYEAIVEMTEKDVGALLVMEADRLEGMISERDYRSKVILKGRTSKTTKVSDIMAEELICVKPTDSIELCMQLMTDKKIRHLPVLEHGDVIGVVSIGDVVKKIIDGQEKEIHSLRSFINGGYPA